MNPWVKFDFMLGDCRFLTENGLYLVIDIGGVTMNEFKNDIQSKTNDVIDSGLGFVFSFVFFFVIFFIGVVFSFIGQ
jgi:hypothetical protein